SAVAGGRSTRSDRRRDGSADRRSGRGADRAARSRRTHRVTRNRNREKEKVMSEQAARKWKGGWTADSPIDIGHVSAPADAGEWKTSRRAGVESRDLGLAGASDGAMSVAHLRSEDGAPETGWQRHDVDFQFIFVTKGSMTVQRPGEDPVELGP